MDFFKKKWVKAVAAAMFVVGGVALILGGADAATLKNIIALIVTAIGGICALIAAIVAVIDGKENKAKAEKKS